MFHETTLNRKLWVRRNHAKKKKINKKKMQQNSVPKRKKNIAMYI